MDISSAPSTIFQPPGLSQAASPNSFTYGALSLLTPSLIETYILGGSILLAGVTAQDETVYRALGAESVTVTRPDLADLRHPYEEPPFTYTALPNLFSPEERLGVIHSLPVLRTAIVGLSSAMETESILLATLPAGRPEKALEEGAALCQRVFPQLLQEQGFLPIGAAMSVRAGELTVLFRRDHDPGREEAAVSV